MGTPTWSFRHIKLFPNLFCQEPKKIGHMGTQSCVLMRLKQSRRLDLKKVQTDGENYKKLPKIA